MKKTLLLIFSILSLLTCTAILAASETAVPNSVSNDNWYQVEVIVFTYPNPAQTKELWPNITKPLNLDNAINLTTADENSGEQTQTLPQVLYQNLSANQWQMQKEDNLLTKNGNYKIIIHTAWLQPIIDQPFSKAKPIHIVGGENYGDEQNPIWQIDGTITLTKSNYFNIKSELLLTERKNELPSNLSNYPESPFNNSKLSSFHVTGNDRMRSNQPYYLDHPLFGMLVEISPYHSN